jgi:hypothetical protein
MDLPSEIDRQLIIDATYVVVSEVAQEEIPDFDDLIAEHDAHPAASTPGMGDPDLPLGFDVTGLVSPEVTGPIMTAISLLFIAFQAELLSETAKALVAAIKARVQRPATLAKSSAAVTPPTLTPEQIQQFHGEVVAVLRERGVTPKRAQHIADTVVGRLLT